MLMITADWRKYAIEYPMSDEPGYDGVHDGGYKGIREDAPEHIKRAYEAEMKMREEALKNCEKL